MACFSAPAREASPLSGLAEADLIDYIFENFARNRGVAISVFRRAPFSTRTLGAGATREECLQGVMCSVKLDSSANCEKKWPRAKRGGEFVFR
jgi:hypothetical protein